MIRNVGVLILMLLYAGRTSAAETVDSLLERAKVKEIDLAVDAEEKKS